jgi:cell fate regulator YaaT (PSP1 superfamily)
MRLLRVRYSFDRSRLLVMFTAEERVDFRQLVADLAAETHSRVEMRQIGARATASILGGLAPCGRRLCCSIWIENFEDIHIRMAKAQGLSLNPATLNGMCGRLKCCLRFENNCYQDLGRDLPRTGDLVECPAGRGKVLETRVLARRIKVCLEDQRVLEFGDRDVIVLGSSTENSDNAPP